MAEGGIDVLMKVVGPKGTLSAESSTVFANKPVMDPLRSGFTPGQFCELREFSFSAGVGGSVSAHEQKRKEAKKLAKAGKPGDVPVRKSELDKMWDIRRAQDKKIRKRAEGEDADMEEVEFTRVLDCMSTQLFTALVNCETLESLSIVKRKAAGSVNSGDCFLRLDFSKVLITNLEWKDSEHLMIESGTFIYRKLTMRYRPQRPNGTLDVAVQTEWEMRRAGQGT